MSEKSAFWEDILGREIISFLRGAFCWLVLSLARSRASACCVASAIGLSVALFHAAPENVDKPKAADPSHQTKISLLLLCATPPALQPGRHWVANNFVTFQFTNLDLKDRLSLHLRTEYSLVDYSTTSRCHQTSVQTFEANLQDPRGPQGTPETARFARSVRLPVVLVREQQQPRLGS